MSKTLALLIESSFVIIFDGWRIVQCIQYRCSSRVFSIVSTKFHLDRERRFQYAFLFILCWRSCCFRFFADISARSSREKNSLKFVINILNFACTMWCQGYRFQLSSLHSIVKAVALEFSEISVRFLAGQACTRTRYQVSRITYSTQRKRPNMRKWRKERTCRISTAGDGGDIFVQTRNRRKEGTREKKQQPGGVTEIFYLTKQNTPSIIL